MKKPLAALALAAATFATLAVPAGASTTSKVTWAHWARPCATGHKTATYVEKWRGSTLQKTWYNDPCSNQYLVFTQCYGEGQSDCDEYAISPHHKGQGAPGTGAPDLEFGPMCGGVFVDGVMSPPCS